MDVDSRLALVIAQKKKTIDARRFSTLRVIKNEEVLQLFDIHDIAYVSLLFAVFFLFCYNCYWFNIIIIIIVIVSLPPLSVMCWDESLDRAISILLNMCNEVNAISFKEIEKRFFLWKHYTVLRLAGWWKCPTTVKRLLLNSDCDWYLKGLISSLIKSWFSSSLS